MHDADRCLNCGTTARLNFCPNCGQETRAHVPSAREFVHEFVTHYIALEGKLWRTLKLLLTKPGKLTTEYIEGRRASYVLPLRIFLTFSILFFATLKLSHVQIANFGGEDERPAQTQNAPERGRTDKPAAPASEEGDNIRIVSGGLGETVSKKLEKFNALPRAEKQRLITAGFYSYAPYAMFLLMPVFALYLKLLYLGSGRRYGEHFLFALHTNAFAYLQITLSMLAPWGWLTFVLVLWLLFYLPIAMRRVYGGTRLATFARWVVLGFLHFVSVALAVVTAIALPALM